MRASVKSILLATALNVAAAPAIAQSKGDVHLGFGVTSVMPKSDNGDLSGLELDIDDATAASFTAEYFVADNIGVELFLSTKLNHDFDLGGVPTGDFELRLPTVSANYHFATNSLWKPYVGIGATYAIVSDESLTGVSIENAWGIGVQAGLDYQVSDQGAFRINLRYIDIDADVKSFGVKQGTADVDPLVVTAAYVFRF